MGEKEKKPALFLGNTKQNNSPFKLKLEILRDCI